MAAPITTIKPRGIDVTGDYVVNSLSGTGNISAGNIKTDHLLYANGTPYVFTTNAAGTNTQIQFNDGNSFAGDANLTFNKTTGTLTAAFLVGNGSQLTGIGTSNVALTVSSNAQPNITSVGTLTSLNIANDLTIGGNLTVNGTTTTVNSTTISVNDINIVLANSASSAVLANGAGITINGANANILYNSTSNSFTFSHPITANGSLLTNVTGANVTGQVANALVSGTVYTNAQPNITSVGTLTSLTVSGILSANTITTGGGTGGNIAGANSISANTLVAAISANLGNSVTANYFIGSGNNLSNIQGANVSGQVANALVAGTVYTAAQPNITSVGTLTGLTVSGNSSLGNIASANLMNLGTGVRPANVQTNSPLFVVSNVASISPPISIQNRFATGYSSMDLFNSSNVFMGAIGGANPSATTIPALSNTVYMYSDASMVSGIGLYASAGNVSFSANGNANILVVTGTGVNVSGNITSQNANLGNLVTANYYSGNGSLLSSLTGANVTGAVGSANTVTNAAQPNITSVGTLTSLSVTGNIIANYASLGTGAATGLFSQPLMVRSNTSNGGSTVGIMNENPNGYSISVFYNNAAVETGAVGFAGVSAPYFANSMYMYSSSASNGLVLSGNLGAAPGNKNLWITNAGLVTIPGNTVASNTTTGAFQVTGGVGVGGNLYAGNLSGTNITGNLTTAAQPNITSVGTLSSLTVTGNVTANKFSGNGSLLTSITGANITGSVPSATNAGTVTTNAQPNITSVGDLTGLTVSGLVTATGTGIKTSNIIDSTGTIAITTHYNNNPGAVGITGNITIGGISDLGVASNVKIQGGFDGYVLSTDGTGNLSWVQQSAGTGGGGTGGAGGESTVTSVDTFTGDGSTVDFELSVVPTSKSQITVNYNGAMQLRSAFTQVGNLITFSEPPADGSQLEISVFMGVTGSVGNLVVRNYVGDGVQASYTVSAGVTATTLLVTENGLVQTPVTDYTVSGTTLTFTTAPAYNMKIQVRELGVAIATITPVGASTQVLFNDAGVFGHSNGFTYNNNSQTLSVTNLISGTILPAAHLTYDLGAPTHRWKDLYLSGNTINLGGASISVDSTSGSVKVTPAPTSENPTPLPVVASSPRFISMVTTGNIITPTFGTSRYYPPKPVNICNVSASLSTASTSNLQFSISKNGTQAATFSILANAHQLTKSSANITLATTDYITVNLLTGDGAAEFRLDLEYKDS